MSLEVIPRLETTEEEGEWKNTGQTMSGNGKDGSDVLFMLQKRGNATRIVPARMAGGSRKGGGKNGRKGDTNGGANGTQSKWDRNGCARCGRSSHWAKECTATTTVDGGVPLEKPDKSHLLLRVTIEWLVKTPKIEVRLNPFSIACPK